MRQVLHVAVLEALMASRRWEPGDLIFQGGTSLHLVHGSPRFSEDLDFLVKSSLKLDTLSKVMFGRLANLRWVPKDMEVSIKAARENRNPHMFDVCLKGASVVGAVRVKVELWQAPEAALVPLEVKVEPVRLIVGPGAGAQAIVPTLSLREIFIDKVFALGARPYLKPRDIFDLYWIQMREPDKQLACTEGDMLTRLATYPNETPQAWLVRSVARRAELLASLDRVRDDLSKWLPTSWPLTSDSVQNMISMSVRALDDGLAVMAQLAETFEPADMDPDDVDQIGPGRG